MISACYSALDYKTERMYIAFMIQIQLIELNSLEREFATDVISGSQFAVRGKISAAGF